MKKLPSIDNVNTKTTHELHDLKMKCDKYSNEKHAKLLIVMERIELAQTQYLKNELEKVIQNIIEIMEMCDLLIRHSNVLIYNIVPDNDLINRYTFLYEKHYCKNNVVKNKGRKKYKKVSELDIAEKKFKKLVDMRARCHLDDINELNIKINRQSDIINKLKSNK